MKVLDGYVKTELTVKNSRFLTELFSCSEQSEARNIIKSQKNKYIDARHVVHAFVIGLNGEILGMSDDGEPGGTAGRPALDVLKGSGVTNVVMTITRWFGGTLLGTGGLVKAYGDSAKAALAKGFEENLFVEYVEKKDFKIECDYSLYQDIKHLLKNYSVSDIEEVFGSSVMLNGKIELCEYEDFCLNIKNLTNGKVIL